ncbi:hypothetical protein E7V67_015215 [[Empedobacter] haloabium]|uniref:Uncharacterized protein n=1 Tax=[Empedobacter] haloabium TaxID=592317 RepID=A0ABZ1UFU3_9BURK
MTDSALRGKIDKRRPDRAYRSRASLQAARAGAIDHGNHGPFEEE